MPGRRIFYYCPRSADPSGGVLTIYHHVETLVRSGVDAAVLHRRQGRPMSWFTGSAPVVTLDSGVAPRHPDILVVPEGDWRMMADTAASGLLRVVFAQGWCYIYGGHEPLPEGADWRTWGIAHVMAVSRYVQRFVRRSMGLPSALVRPGVDLDLFRPAPRKRLQVACMPRKNPGDLQQIQGIFRSRFPHHRHVPFVPIDGLPREDTAALLAASAGYLATGYPEGFPLPPIEALASGCLVVGFTGRGGGDYLHHGRNSLLAADGDVATAADRLGQALDLLAREGEAGDAPGEAAAGDATPGKATTSGAGPGAAGAGDARPTATAAALVAAGLATAARFSRQASERAILRFWQRHLDAGGAGGGSGGGESDSDGYPSRRSRTSRRGAAARATAATAATAAAAATTAGPILAAGRRGRGLSRRVAVLSVHYRYPPLFADQVARLARCVEPTERALGLRLEFYPIVHHSTLPEVAAAVREGCVRSGFAACLDVSAELAAAGSRGGRVHGAGLAAAFEQLRTRLHLEPDDLVVLLDHDTHPLDVGLFARLGETLAEHPELAAIGIPQWQRGHRYLHPSLLATRAAAIFEMGTRTAFEVRLPADEKSDDWHDTGEGFTAWCERAGRPLQALRVNATRFPWKRWDSDMVADGGTRLTGEHGEAVEVGNLMHYGLDGSSSLASHLWAGPLGPYRWLDLADCSFDTALAEYLAEPLAG